jgi:hypothetical protein
MNRRRFFFLFEGLLLLLGRILPFSRNGVIFVKPVAEVEGAAPQGTKGAVGIPFPSREGLTVRTFPLITHGVFILPQSGVSAQSEILPAPKKNLKKFLPTAELL